MNFSHLKTISWLRWRLIVNQLNKVGKAHRIFTIVIIVGALIGSLGLFFLTWFGTGAALEEIPSSGILLVWSGIVCAFLFAWSIGVLTDLQKSEPLSLAKFLHLPVSPRGAFLNNFLSSFICFSMILMFPIMLGFSFGMVNHYGPRMITGILLLLAFMLLVAAVTYQFRGWLAALMVNKRRRRTIITCMTFGIILVSQVPNLLNMSGVIDFAEVENGEESAKQQANRTKVKLNVQLANKEITKSEFDTALIDLRNAKKQRRLRILEKISNVVRTATVFVPFGWLPLGMESLVKGDGLLDTFAVPLACLVLMIGLTVMSLQRSYVATLRLYRGEVAQEKPRTTSNEPQEEGEFKPTWMNRIMEKKFPLLNEQQSTVAASTLVGLLRAPEAKMALLTPFAVMVFLGISFVWQDKTSIPVELRPFTGIGIATFVMFGIMQLINNQFGYDRDGFRCMVLSPLKRKDILIGKNLGFAPFAIGIGIIGILTMQCFIPMKITHFLATFVQLGTVYLITCMVANLMSIRAPLAIASGTMKPLNMNLSIIVIQILITLLLPIGLLPTMIPPGIELFATKFMGVEGIPIYLILSFLLLAVTLVVYRFVIAAQGEMLEREEKQILNTVTQVGS